MKKPDHRFHDVKSIVEKKGKAPKKGEHEKALFAILSGKGSTASAVSRAYDVYQSSYKREVIEAFLLIGITAKEVNEILRVDTEITEAYQYLFFDTSVFEDELDVIEYAHTYDRSEFGKELKLYAVEMGSECLKVRMSRGTYVAPASHIQESIRSTALMMAQLVKANDGDSSLANAALRWAQIGLKAASEDEEPEDSGIEKLRIALENRDETTDEKKSGIPKAEILH